MTAMNYGSFPPYVYVASSWKNPRQSEMCAALEVAGIDHYDFKRPHGGEDGFRWTDVFGGEGDYGLERTVPMADYINGMQTEVARLGFKRDFEAMRNATHCILVLPCNRSAHLELGWFVGKGIKTCVLLEDPVVPELMYGMVGYLAPEYASAVSWVE